jgi:peptide/nickel transport system permease protein
VAGYLVKRIWQTLLFIVFAIVFMFTLLVYFMPDSPAKERSMAQAGVAGLQEAASQPITDTQSSQMHDLYVQQIDEANSTIKDLETRYKLDRPWPLSFLAWLYDPSDTTQLDGNLQVVPKGIDITIGDIHLVGSGLLTGDLGTSATRRTGKRPVSELLSDRWVNTVLLMSVSLLLAVVVAVPIGIVTAVKQRSKLEHAITFSLFAGISMPPFVLGLVLISFLALIPKVLHNRAGLSWLPYLPISDVTDFGKSNDLLNHLYHLVLPAITLALIQAVWLSRHLRSAMLEVLGQDYIRTARAKGLGERRVILKHALRNAFISLSTVLGLLLPGLVSGTIVVERVFNYAGMGLLFFDGFGGCIDPTHEIGCPGGTAPDYPLALVLTVILVILVAFSNLLADLMYTVVDPRISFEK